MIGERGWTTWGVRKEILGALTRSTVAAREPISYEAAIGDEPPPAGGIAVIRLKGLITAQPSIFSLIFGGGYGLNRFRSDLREAVGSNDISAIVLEIDSPGGSTDMIAETAAEIRAARAEKPVVAVANTMAASAAYWLASQADEIVVTPSGEVGSIGVFALHWDETGLNEKLGVDPTFVYAGKYKVEGNPFEPLSEEARAAMQVTVDEYYDMFVNDVAEGRGVPAATVRDGYGEGRMVTAKRAVTLGMADSVNTLEGAIEGLNGDTSRRGRVTGEPQRPEPAAGGIDPEAGEQWAAEEQDESSEGTPPPNSTEEEPAVDEEAAARSRRTAVERQFA